MTKLTILYQPIDALKPRANNPRTHSPDQIKQLKNSISHFGFTNPVLMDDNNTIIAGHGRVMAAKELGFTEVPTVCLSG
ncbi:MAG: ParB/Srx family N-terminal domain-containing protein, partial [Rickettsiales bacterium]